MEELIKQAFLHVDIIGPHVQSGHYDLIGPNGEIILPQVWEKVIEPDWAVTMHMWPMDRQPMGMGRPPAGPVHPQMAGARPGQLPPRGVAMPGHRPGAGPPPPPNHHPGMMGQMGGAMGGMRAHMAGMQNGRPTGLDPNARIVQVEKISGGKKAKPKSSGVLGWMVGSGGGKSGAKGKRFVVTSIYPVSCFVSLRVN